jgi:hypothetical protein
VPWERDGIDGPLACFGAVNPPRLLAEAVSANVAVTAIATPAAINSECLVFDMSNSCVREPMGSDAGSLAAMPRG